MIDLQTKIEQLNALGAADFDHVDGNLLDHFLGTRAILESWGADDELLDAGLFHAAYSTAGFEHSLMDSNSRQHIISIIGEAAEHIVYTFCACDREIFYARLVAAKEARKTPLFRNRFTAEDYALEDRLLNDFCELTVANEIEIAQGNDKFIRKHGPDRYRFYNAMSPYLSVPARQCVDSVFG